jgi:hypothetical protein
MVRNLNCKGFSQNAKLITSMGGMDVTGASSLVFLMKPEEESRFYQRQNGANGTQFVVAENGGEGKPSILTGGGTVFCPTKLYKRKEWVLLIVQFPGGAEAKPIFRAYGFASKTWTHAEGATNLKAPKTTAGGEVIFGTSKEVGGNFKIAAFAQYAISFTQAEAEAFSSMATIEAMGTKSPVAFIDFGQREVAQGIKDWSGSGAAQTSQENSEVIEEAPPIFFSPRMQITWLIVTDSLKHAALESFFTAIPWNNGGTGTWSATLGWAPASFLNSPTIAQDRSGIYFNTTTYTGSAAGNAAAALQISTNIVAAERTLNTWIFLNASKSTPTGYQISAVGTNPAVTSTYDIYIKEWNEGVEVKSVKVASQLIEPTGEFAIAVFGGVVYGFIRKLSSSDWVQVAEFSSTTFTEGRAGIGGNGSNPKVLNFRGANLDGPSGAAGKTVQVLKEGALVKAKRWVLRSGELVNA